jgi:hypothetical protein
VIVLGIAGVLLGASALSGILSDPLGFSKGNGKNWNQYFIQFYALSG